MAISARVLRENLAQYLGGAREVVGGRRSAQERNARTPGQRDLSDLLVVRRHHDLVEAPGRQGCLDGVGDDRSAQEKPDVLARNPLAAATGWDDGDARSHPNCCSGIAPLRSAAPRRRNASPDRSVANISRTSPGVDSAMLAFQKSTYCCRNASSAALPWRLCM